MTLRINYESGYADRNQGGTIEVSGEVIEFSGKGAINVTREFMFPITPGTVVSVNTLAKAVKGSGVVAITFFKKNNQSIPQVQYYSVNHSEYHPINLKVVAPFDPELGHVRISIGKFSVKDEESQLSYTNTFVEFHNGDSNKYVLANGTIKLSAAGEGSASLNTSFRSSGVKSIEKVDQYTVRVNLKSKFRNENRPIAFLTGTTELNAIPLAGQVNEDKFDIKISNGTEYLPIKKDASIYFELAY